MNVKLIVLEQNVSSSITCYKSFSLGWYKQSYSLPKVFHYTVKEHKVIVRVAVAPVMCDDLPQEQKNVFGLFQSPTLHPGAFV